MRAWALGLALLAAGCEEAEPGARGAVDARAEAGAAGDVGGDARPTGDGGVADRGVAMDAVGFDGAAALDAGDDAGLEDARADGAPRADAGRLDAAPAPDGAIEADARVTEDAAPGPDAAAPPPAEAAWCGHQWPPVARAAVADPSPTFFGRTYLDPVFAADHPSTVSIGHGPPGTRPGGAGWMWTPAERNDACDGCGDEVEYAATLTLDFAGPRDVAWRLETPGFGPLYCDRRDGDRQGSADGYDPADAARLIVRRARLVLATANLRCLRDDWDRRLPLLVDALAEVDPDLLALQEVCRAPDDSEDALPLLLDALAARTGRVYAHHRRETHLAWDTWQEGVAIVSAFDVLGRADAALPAERLPRAAAAVRVQTPLGPAVAAVTHLAAEADQAAQRVQQAEAAIGVLDGLAQPGDLRVLMGDFNEVPGGDAVAATLAADFTDAWAAVHGDAPGPTFPSDAPARRIDYVFVDAAAEVLEGERFLDVEVDSVRPSDHLGVRAGLR